MRALVSMVFPLYSLALRDKEYFGFDLAESIYDTCRPKSGEQDDQIAPREVASMAITA